MSPFTAALAGALGTTPIMPNILQNPNATILFSTISLNGNTTAASYFSYTQWGQNITLANTSATTIQLSNSHTWNGLTNVECIFQTSGNPGDLNVINLNSSHSIATSEVEVYWICCGVTDSKMCGGLDRFPATVNGTLAKSTSTTISTLPGGMNSTVMTNNATTSTLLSTTTTTMPLITGTGSLSTFTSPTVVTSDTTSMSTNGAATNTPPAPSATQSRHNSASGVAIGAAAGLSVVGVGFAMFL